MSSPPPRTELASELNPEDWATFTWLHDKYERLIVHEDQLFNVRMSTFSAIFAALVGALALVSISTLNLQTRAVVALVLLGLMWVITRLWEVLLGTGRTLESRKAIARTLEKLIAEHHPGLLVEGDLERRNPFHPYLEQRREPRFASGLLARLTGRSPSVTQVTRLLPRWIGWACAFAFAMTLIVSLALRVLP